MRSLLGPILSLLLLPTVACKSISKAPAESPRVETELTLEMDGSLESALILENRADLAFLLEEAILPHADLGLRLYAVPSPNYSSEHKRPDYLMKITIQDFDVFVYQDVIRGTEGVPDRLVDKVDFMTCSVRATIDRRRANGPNLEVARSVGEAKLEPTEKRDTLFNSQPMTLRYATVDGNPLYVEHQDVARVVEKAMIDALRKLEEPVDREFLLMTGPREPQAKSTTPMQP